MAYFDKLKLNFNIFEFKHKKIKNEIDQLIEELNIDEIPTREAMITDIYYKEFVKYDILNIRQNSSYIEIKKKKTKSELLGEFLDKLKTENDINQKNQILKDIFALFDSVNNSDKEVLITSLLSSTYEEIKNNIDSLIQSFPLD